MRCAGETSAKSSSYSRFLSFFLLQFWMKIFEVGLGPVKFLSENGDCHGIICNVRKVTKDSNEFCDGFGVFADFLRFFD